MGYTLQAMCPSCHLPPRPCAPSPLSARSGCDRQRTDRARLQLRLPWMWSEPVHWLPVSV